LKCICGLVRRSLSQSLKIDYKRLHNQSQNQRDILTVIVFLVLYSNFCPYDHMSVVGWLLAAGPQPIPQALCGLLTLATQ